jgi:hypothetical protein
MNKELKESFDKKRQEMISELFTYVNNTPNKEIQLNVDLTVLECEEQVVLLNINKIRVEEDDLLVSCCDVYENDEYYEEDSIHCYTMDNIYEIIKNI